MHMGGGEKEKDRATGGEGGVGEMSQRPANKLRGQRAGCAWDSMRPHIHRSVAEHTDHRGGGRITTWPQMPGKAKSRGVLVRGGNHAGDTAPYIIYTFGRSTA